VDAMVAAANERCEGQVATVIGGFHLHGQSRARIEQIGQALQELGIQRAGPCHCSGDTAREVFAGIFGNDYLDVHVGTRLTLKPPDEATQ
jgi:7,8-dihydropterin-6-yl-methyl-4-(beta-D-ribofuranosyl)aminobenzene 5'-phosphate synthase